MRFIFNAGYARLPPQTRCRKTDFVTPSVSLHGGEFAGSGALAISGARLLYFYTTFCGLTLIEPPLFLRRQHYRRD